MARGDYVNLSSMVIGAVLHSGKLISQDNVKVLPDEAFGRDAVIWRAMKEISSQQDVTTAALTMYFRHAGWDEAVSETRPENARSGVNRINHLAQIGERAVPDFDALVAELNNSFIRATISERLAGIHRASLEGDPTMIRQRLIDEIINFAPTLQGGETTAEKVKRVVADRRNPSFGITHQIPGLSKLIPEFDYGWLIGLAAMTKGMKSTLARQYAINTGVKQGIPTLIVSLENFSDPTVNSIASSIAGVPASLRGPKLMTHQLSALDRAAAEVAQRSETLHFFDDPDIHAITARVRELSVRNVIIDQLSHLSGLRANQRSGENRSQDYGNYCKHIAEKICKGLGATVILVHQLKDYKDTNRPTIRRDFADSAEIARYVDLELLLHQPPEMPYREILMDIWRHGPIPANPAANVVFNSNTGMFEAAL